jgi:hypothetical protein
MRLQHGDFGTIPRFAAGCKVRRVLFGFRKARESVVQSRDLPCKITNGIKLGFAHGIPAAIRTAPTAAIGANRGWNDQSVEEQDGNSEDE